MDDEKDSIALEACNLVGRAFRGQLKRWVEERDKQ